MEPLIWSTVLDHICIQTSASKAMRDFYRDALDMQEVRLNKTSWFLEGADRRLILSEGISKTIDYSGFRVLNDNQLICLRRCIEAKSGGIIESPSPLFQQGAFGVGHLEWHSMESITPQSGAILECWIGVALHLVECGLEAESECKIALYTAALQFGDKFALLSCLGFKSVAISIRMYSGVPI